MEKLLIVEDNQEISKQLKWGLGREYNLLFAQNVPNAISLLKKNHPKIVTLDLGLPPNENDSVEGFRCLEELVRHYSDTKVIVITGNDDRETALRAIQIGAYDFYEKPIDLKELKVIISRAFHLYNIEEENRKLHERIGKESSSVGSIIGQCPGMEEIFATARKVASSDISVLIEGESGTGKELVAKAVHLMSMRRGGDFIPINCGAIPDNLLESELFGHEKGAFTGALTQVQGKVEYADKGTLFLDEIGELPVNLQVKLLRFLQDKTIQRVGGREDIHVDARIIAATNKDIIKATQEGVFREDLYYRIGVITIKLPPLRERGNDIVLLSKYFLNKFSNELRKKVRGFSTESIELLKSYKWPGNVRELENRIQRAIIMNDSSLIEPRSLGFTDETRIQSPEVSEGISLKEARENIERRMIEKAIERHNGNIAKASGELKISRPTLYDLMKKHGFMA